MSARQVNKQLGGQEDLLFGRGTVTQDRNGISVDVTKITMIYPVLTLAALKLLSYDTFPFSYLTDYGYYTYDSTSTATADDVEVIEPSTGIGRWLLTTTAVALELGQITDVDITTVADGQVLAYNSTSGSWENIDAVSSIGDLVDVDVTGAVDGNVLTYNATLGIWEDAPAGGIPANLTLDSLTLSGGTGDQGKMTWNTDEETVDLIQDGATLQLGQEVQFHCRNSTGVTIPDGTVVMATGTIGASGRITMAPYDNVTDVKYILGVTTYDVLDGADGKVTMFGKVRGLDTSAWVDGDILYTTTGGGLTSTEPTSGVKNALAFVIYSHATAGSIMVRSTPIDGNRVLDSDIAAIRALEATNEPNGYDRKSPTTMGDVSFTDLTRTFTIQPQGGETEFVYYREGVKVTKTAPETVVLPDVSGLYIIYFGASDTLIATTTITDDIFTKYAVTAYVYWNATTQESVGFGDERHGIQMDGETHRYLHLTEGSRYISGMTPDLTDNATDFGASGIASGRFLDEDIDVSIAQQLTLPTLKLDGAIWTKEAAGTSLSLEYLATGRPAYNFNNLGTWEQADVGIGNFMCMHIYATNDTNYPYTLIQGQEVYTNRADARTGITTEINNLYTESLPYPEFVPVASYIIDSSRQLETTEEGDVFVDWRQSTKTGGSTTPTDHASLINRDAADQHIIGAVTGLQAALDSKAALATAQTFTASQRGTITTDNDLSFDLAVTNNFECTPTVAGTLTFTNITSGQSGNILLDNTGGYVISAAASIKKGADMLTDISTAGVYWLSYYTRGTDVYVSYSEALS